MCLIAHHMYDIILSVKLNFKELRFQKLNVMMDFMHNIAFVFYKLLHSTKIGWYFLL